MSPFEIVMLLCFGFAWPLSIWKLLKTKSSTGKSVLFLLVLLCGYTAGILHKVFYAYDRVIILYAINMVMVSIDLALVIYYRSRPTANKG